MLFQHQRRFIKNRQRPVFDDAVQLYIAKQGDLFTFEPWDAPGDRASVIRLVTSWGTTEEDIMEFMKLL